MHVAAAAAGLEVVDVRQRESCEAAQASSSLAYVYHVLPGCSFQSSLLHMPNWGMCPSGCAE
jgi:hypothetical protein